MNDQKLETLEVGRGVAAALVVAYHAIEIVAGTGAGSPLGLFRFGYAGVDFFFVLSGFLIYHRHAVDIGCKERVSAYLRKRFVRIYPTYWIVMAALIAAMVLVPSVTDAYKRSFGFVLQSLLLLPQEEPPLLGVSWSLCYEQAFYLLFTIAIVNRKAGSAVAALVTAISFSDLFFEASYPLAFLCNIRVLEFFLGIGAAVAVGRITPRLSMRRPLSLAVTAFACVGLVDAFVWKLSTEWAMIGYGIPSAVIIWAAVCAERQASFRIPRPFVLAGAASYSVYLVHWPAAVIMSRLLAKLHLGPNFAWLIVTALGITAGVVFHVCVERRVLKFISAKRREQRSLFDQRVSTVEPNVLVQNTP